MSSAPRVFLVFNGDWLEVDAALAERRGGLRAIAREAESKWTLQPNLYEFQSSTGKVDSWPALQRALEDARNGVCKLDVAERPEGEMKRTMHVEMKLLEDRVMAKVEAVMAGVVKDAKMSNARLNGCIAPMVQCLATEQIELRNKLGQLNTQVGNLVTGSLGPMVQCIAAEQIEMRNKLDFLVNGSIAPMMQCLAKEQMELQQKLDQLSTQVGDLRADTPTTVADAAACALKDAETLERELQQECAMQTACDLDLSNTVNVKELKEEVSQLKQADRAMFTKITSQPDHKIIMDAKQNFGIAYSNKMGKGLSGGTMFEAKWNPADSWSCEVAAPFAQSVTARQMHFSKSTLGHRSCPVLPPLY